MYEVSITNRQGQLVGRFTSHSHERAVAYAANHPVAKTGSVVIRCTNPGVVSNVGAEDNSFGDFEYPAEQQ